MKKNLILLVIFAILASFFAGCGEPSEQASGTIPWGAPASFEGAGVGLPQMEEMD